MKIAITPCVVAMDFFVYGKSLDRSRPRTNLDACVCVSYANLAPYDCDDCDDWLQEACHVPNSRLHRSHYLHRYRR